MSGWKAVTTWIVLLCGGGLGGWALRGRRDQKWLEEIKLQALELQMLTSGPRVTVFKINHEPEPPPTPAEHNAELRCLMHDPEAVAVAATVRRVTRTGDFVTIVFEIELETARGTFEIELSSGKEPTVGQTVELFGRPESVPRPGHPPRLDPGWLEPVGTLAQLAKQK
jgi:hypothetical protein